MPSNFKKMVRARMKEKNESWQTAARYVRSQAKKKEPIIIKKGDPRIEPNWDKPCDNCGAVPTVPLTGLCGPCTWGESETIGGNW